MLLFTVHSLLLAPCCSVSSRPAAANVKQQRICMHMRLIPPVLWALGHFHSRCSEPCCNEIQTVEHFLVLQVHKTVVRNCVSWHMCLHNVNTMHLLFCFSTSERCMADLCIGIVHASWRLYYRRHFLIRQCYTTVRAHAHAYKMFPRRIACFDTVPWQGT